jgi:hypothetical protein
LGNILRTWCKHIGNRQNQKSCWVPHPTSPQNSNEKNSAFLSECWAFSHARHEIFISKKHVCHHFQIRLMKWKGNRGVRIWIINMNH